MNMQKEHQKGKGTSRKQGKKGCTKQRSDVMWRDKCIRRAAAVGGGGYKDRVGRICSTSLSWRSSLGPRSERPLLEECWLCIHVVRPCGRMNEVGAYPALTRPDLAGMKGTFSGKKECGFGESSGVVNDA